MCDCLSAYDSKGHHKINAYYADRIVLMPHVQWRSRGHNNSAKSYIINGQWLHIFASHCFRFHSINLLLILYNETILQVAFIETNFVTIALFISIYNLSAVAEEPEFTDIIANVTVPAGRNVQMACSVKNLGTFKVRINFCRKSHESFFLLWFYKLLFSTLNKRVYFVKLNTVWKTCHGKWYGTVSMVLIMSNVRSLTINICVY